MKLPWFIIALVISITLVGGFWWVGSHKDSVATNTTLTEEKQVDACALFTEQDAESVLGEVVKKAQSPFSDTKMGNIVVTHCVYSSTSKSISILIRKANNPDEAKTLFNDSKKSLKDSQKTAMPTGDDEYWVPSLGQYNILKNDKWIITSTGATENTDSTLAKKAAGIVVSRL